LAGKGKELKEYFHQLFENAFFLIKIRPRLIYNLSIELILYILRVLKKYGYDVSVIVENEDKLINTVFFHDKETELEKWVGSIAGRAIDEIQTKNKNKHKKVIEDIIVFIEENYMKDISLKALSNDMYFNAEYIGRLFRRETGEVFTDFVNKVRLNKSKTLLRETNLKAADIAQNVGFININYFYSIFKKYSGMTPTEYRNSL
jgi:two-component system response regulator YesN